MKFSDINRCAHVPSSIVYVSLSKLTRIFSFQRVAMAMLRLTVCVWFFHFPCNRKLRDSVRSKLIVALSVNHILFLIVFLAGVESTDSSSYCQAVALLLHYFLLSTFSWMASSSYLLFVKIIIVVHVLSTKFVQKAVVFSQGMHRFLTFML